MVGRDAPFDAPIRATTRPAIRVGARRASSLAVYAAGTAVCTGGQFSPAPGLDVSTWVRAGTTATGHVVYVPAASNPIAHAIRVAQLDASWTMSADYSGMVTGADAGYPYTTDKAFRDAKAFYAIQGPDGVWQLRLRMHATSVVYECV